jgi:hypothetical protein
MRKCRLLRTIEKIAKGIDEQGKYNDIQMAPGAKHLREVQISGKQDRLGQTWHTIANPNNVDVRVPPADLALFVQTPRRPRSNCNKRAKNITTLE